MTRSNLNYDQDYGYNGSRSKLRRNKVDSVLGGVCAGLADWLGIAHGAMRVFFVLAIIFTGLPVLLYFLMWIFIPSNKGASYVRKDREQRRGRVETSTIRTAHYSGAHSKFRSLEERLNDLERTVTSREWKLRRDFADLKA